MPGTRRRPGGRGVSSGEICAQRRMLILPYPARSVNSSAGFFACLYAGLCCDEALRNGGAAQFQQFSYISADLLHHASIFGILLLLNLGPDQKGIGQASAKGWIERGVLVEHFAVVGQHAAGAAVAAGGVHGAVLQHYLGHFADRDADAVGDVAAIDDEKDDYAILALANGGAGLEPPAG